MHHFWDFNTALHTQTRLWAIGHCFFLWSLNTKYKDFPHDFLSLSSHYFSHVVCKYHVVQGWGWMKRESFDTKIGKNLIAATGGEESSLKWPLAVLTTPSSSSSQWMNEREGRVGEEGVTFFMWKGIMRSSRGFHHVGELVAEFWPLLCMFVCVLWSICWSLNISYFY